MTTHLIDPNDKPLWIEQGEREEERFVREIAPAYRLAARINPEKRLNPCVPDLLVGKVLADLKTRRTPFFTAGRSYGFDPQFTVTLNRNDVERYASLWQKVEIYFWVHWHALQGRFGDKTYTVSPLEGVWRTNVGAIQERIRSGEAVLHQYRDRIDDTRGNARESYLLDLAWMEDLRLRCRDAA